MVYNDQSTTLMHTATVTLKQLFAGTVLAMTIKHRRLCTTCHATCSLGCTTCSGFGHAQVETEMRFEVPKGCVGGMVLTYEGQGHQYRPTQAPGALCLTIIELPDDQFARKGHDLHFTFQLTPGTSSGDFNVPLVHLNGIHYEVHIPPNVAGLGKPRMVPNLGFHLHGASQPGALYIHFKAPLNQPLVIKGPTCYLMSRGSRPIGTRQPDNSSYGGRYKWSCCGAQAKEPFHHY